MSWPFFGSLRSWMALAVLDSFRGFSIVGLPWHRGVSWMQRLVLGLQPGRSRLGLNVALGPRSANRVTSTTPDDGISTEPNERFVLHDREIDTPTLSPECQQPCHQSVKNPPIPITDSVSGPSDHESADVEFLVDDRRVGVFVPG